MSRNVVETVLGAVVLAVAIGFFVYAYTRSSVSTPTGYTLTAAFDRVDGLDVGADVKISGIKVGKVLGQDLDPQTYRARVRFSVESGIELPSDSSAVVTSSSLLGGKYLSLAPGAEDKMLADGGQITLTQSSMNLEDLVSRFVFGQGAGSKDSTEVPPAADQPLQ